MNRSFGNKRGRAAPGAEMQARDGWGRGGGEDTWGALWGALPPPTRDGDTPNPMVVECCEALGCRDGRLPPLWLPEPHDHQLALAQPNRHLDPANADDDPMTEKRETEPPPPRAGGAPAGHWPVEEAVWHEVSGVSGHAEEADAMEDPARTDRAAAMRIFLTHSDPGKCVTPSAVRVKDNVHLVWTKVLHPYLLEGEDASALLKCRERFCARVIRVLTDNARPPDTNDGLLEEDKAALKLLREIDTSGVVQERREANAAIERLFPKQEKEEPGQRRTKITSIAPALKRYLDNRRLTWPGEAVRRGGVRWYQLVNTPPDSTKSKEVRRKYAEAMLGMALSGSLPDDAGTRGSPTTRRHRGAAREEDGGEARRQEEVQVLREALEALVRRAWSRAPEAARDAVWEQVEQKVVGGGGWAKFHGTAQRYLGGGRCRA